MGETLKDVIALLGGYVDNRLISTEHLSLIAGVLDDFPAGLSGAFGYEIRLNDLLPASDFAFAIRHDNRHKTTQINRRLLSNHYWQNIDRLFREWRNDDSLIRNLVDQVWLEFDIDGPPADIVVPGVFINFMGNTTTSGYTRDDIMRGTKQLLRTLGGDVVPDYVLENARQLLTVLPDRCPVKYLGYMPARHPGVMRYSVLFEQSDDIAAIVREVFPDFDKAHMLNFCNQLFEYSDLLILNFDIGKKIYPKTGIECRFSTDELTYNKQYRRKPFIEYLTAENYCLRDKGEALLSWPGASREVFSKALYKSVTYRLIHYFKAVYEPDKPVEFKAYFGYLNNGVRVENGG